MVPSLARSLVTVPAALTTHILAPSKAMPSAPYPTVYVPRTVPSEARNLVTVFAPLLVTQTLAPSNAVAIGLSPTGKVPSVLPSLARSFVTVPGPVLGLFGAQMFRPSKVIHPG